MELPRELWEGQNLKVVTHKCVDIDVDPFGDRWVQSFYGGTNPFTDNLSPLILAVMLATLC